MFKKSHSTMSKSIFHIPNNENINVEFSFSGVHVSSNPKNLIIHILTSIEDFDSSSESARYSRPKLLITLGILSFFTGKNYSVYQVESSSSSKLIEESFINNKDRGFSFITENHDHSEDIKKVCDKIDSEALQKNTLLFSLLDRWRKAQYQNKESDGQGLFEDESLLSYFHVLELLVSEYQEIQKKEAEDKFSTFLESLLESTYKFRGVALQNKTQEKFKKLKDIFLSSDMLTIGSKINYMLASLGMLNYKVQYVVEELIQARNAIAHGRQVFKDKLIWPLPPFFMLHQHHLDLVSIVEILSARTIAQHYGLSVWADEWDSVLEYLPPPVDTVKNFIKENKFIGLSLDQYFSGIVDDVTPYNIFGCYLKSKIRFEEMETCLSDLIEAVEVTEENSEEILYISIILADSKSEKINAKCRFFINHINSNKMYNSLNIKDYLRFLEYNNVKPKYFREWIENSLYLNKT